MATSKLVTTNGTSHYRGQHQVVYEYLVELDQIETNPLQVVTIGRGLQPDPIPSASAVLVGYNMFAQTFKATPTTERRDCWKVVVTFAPPPSGEDDTQNNPQLLPWQRAPSYDVRSIDKEWVIDRAWNRDTLSGTRSPVQGVPDTDNDPDKQIPICNSLLIEPDAPTHIDAERNIVFVIHRNYQFLNDFIGLQQSFARSTNSDLITLQGTPTIQIPQYALRYRGTFSRGLRYEEVDPQYHPGFPDNRVSYYPCTTEIEWVTPNTHLEVNNVSYHKWDAAAINPEDNIAGAAVPITVPDPDAPNDQNRKVPTVVPLNVTLDGALSQEPVKASWRYLKSTPYQGFFP